MVRLIILIISIMFVAVSTYAAIGQSASEALSYRSMVSGGRAQDYSHVTKQSPKIQKTKPNKPKRRKPKKNQPIKHVYEVDMMSSFINSVWVNPGDEIEVTLKETPDIQWRSSFNSSSIGRVSENKEGEERKIRFWQKSASESTIFFDCLDLDGKIIKNKSLDIKVK